MKIKFAFLGLIACMISPAHALVDLRLGYGLTMGDPAQYNSTVTGLNSAATSLKSMAGLNADVLIKLPLVPIGFGLRYESLSDSKGNSSTLGTKVNFDRLALLLNYRLIDTLAYFGPIATYGLTNTAKLTLDCATCSPAQHLAGKADSASSYSVGIEAGAKLLQFRVGGELGYASYVGKNYTDNGTVYQDSSGSNVKIDLTGMYAKVLLGIGF